MNIAVIGHGSMPQLLADGLAASGHTIWVSDYHVGQYVQRTYDQVNICNIEIAAAESEIIVVGTAPNQVGEAAYYMGDVRHKIIIDLSAHKFFRLGFYVNTIETIKKITGAKDVVKLFNPMAFSRLFASESVSAHTLMVGNSFKAKEITRILSRDFGFDQLSDLGSDIDLPAFDEIVLEYHAASLKHLSVRCMETI